jgi:hypothetical protein
MNRLRAYEEGIEMRSYLALSLAGIGELDQARQELEPNMTVVGVSPSQDYSMTEPNPRRAVVVSALAEIELAEGDIDGGLDRYRQMLKLLDWPHAMGAPGPGDLVMISAVIDAYVLRSRASEVEHLVTELIDHALPRLKQYWDLPQIGSVACAVASQRLATGRDTVKALELLALAPRTHARQDYPSMRMDLHIALHRPAVGDERMDAVLRAGTVRGRRKAAERIMALLGEIAGHD